MERKVIESGSVQLIASSHESDDRFELFAVRDSERIDAFNEVEVAFALSALKRASKHFENRRRIRVLDAINRSLL